MLSHKWYLAHKCLRQWFWALGGTDRRSKSVLEWRVKNSCAVTWAAQVLRNISWTSARCASHSLLDLEHYLLGFYWLHASPVVVMFTGLWYDGLYLLFKDLLSVFTHRFVSTRFISAAEMCAATKKNKKKRDILLHPEKVPEKQLFREWY